MAGKKGNKKGNKGSKNNATRKASTPPVVATPVATPLDTVTAPAVVADELAQPAVRPPTEALQAPAAHPAANIASVSPAVQRDAAALAADDDTPIGILGGANRTTQPETPLPSHVLNPFPANAQAKRVPPIVAVADEPVKSQADQPATRSTMEPTTADTTATTGGSGTGAATAEVGTAALGLNPQQATGPIPPTVPTTASRSIDAADVSSHVSSGAGADTDASIKTLHAASHTDRVGNGSSLNGAVPSVEPVADPRQPHIVNDITPTATKDRLQGDAAANTTIPPAKVPTAGTTGSRRGSANQMPSAAEAAGSTHSSKPSNASSVGARKAGTGLGLNGPQAPPQPDTTRVGSTSAADAPAPSTSAPGPAPSGTTAPTAADNATAHQQQSTTTGEAPGTANDAVPAAGKSAAHPPKQNFMKRMVRRVSRMFS
ncbi:hypothetical protein IWQ60_003004 [Tieghemiomyces parasiticus]|uniref:Uncharacterized protein n=1 Tax=Tieghemiomyces parasiticus TaxID=78921 RepID=A0A9W8DWV3_9FUNG|nr:hypothetical protein IWQ60_003004 [Tieghemiomyces parasiticus]